MCDYSMEEIHKVELGIAKEFIKICSRYNLTYYIIGGTFLGAVRHKGFIPWDDDMDFAMPRKDFDCLMKIANDELPSNMALKTFYNDENHWYFLPKIVNIDYEIIEDRYKSINKKGYLFIDIFPIDGTPNNIVLKKIYYFRIMFHRMLASWYYIDVIDPHKKRGALDKILILMGKVLPTKKLIDPQKQFKKIDSLLKRNDCVNSKEIGTIMGAYRIREIVPKEYFGIPTFYKFEDLLLSGPEMYDKYLTHIYGDYMTPPKKETQVQHFS